MRPWYKAQVLNAGLVYPGCHHFIVTRAKYPFVVERVREFQT